MTKLVSKRVPYLRPEWYVLALVGTDKLDYSIEGKKTSKTDDDYGISHTKRARAPGWGSSGGGCLNRNQCNDLQNTRPAQRGDLLLVLLVLLLLLQLLLLL